MTLLNHLFGNNKSTAKELAMDEQKRITLWDEHIVNYESREQLCTHFNFANVNKALEDFETTKEILSKIESLISPELINIDTEEKTEEEILEDLKKLKSTDDIEKISDAAVEMYEKGEHIIKLLQEIHDVLKAELHLIKLVKNNPTKELLLNLFQIIYHKEAMLYKVFRERKFREETKDIHESIIKIARTILIEEEIKEEKEKFAQKMYNGMNIEDSKSIYRKLGEDIFFTLAAMAGAPLSKDADITEGLKRMEEFIQDDKVMYIVLKKLRPRYDDAKIKDIITVFRKAHKFGHFIDLEDEFAT